MNDRSSPWSVDRLIQAALAILADQKVPVREVRQRCTHDPEENEVLVRIALIVPRSFDESMALCLATTRALIAQGARFPATTTLVVRESSPRAATDTLLRH